MCGRFTITCDQTALVARFGITQVINAHEPRYNVAPTQAVPVVIADGGGRSLIAMQWGLVPSWAKDPAVGARMINARIETVAEKPSYRTPFRRRRCLVPADGFYEWAKVAGAARKQPYRFTLENGSPFAFAGLYDQWEGADGSFLLSFTLITTKADAVVSPIHERMPAILSPEAEGPWLSRALQAPQAVAALLQATPSLRGYPVSPVVGDSKYDAADCIAEYP